jgi:hypothetical protein
MGEIPLPPVFGKEEENKFYLRSFLRGRTFFFFHKMKDFIRRRKE